MVDMNRGRVFGGPFPTHGRKIRSKTNGIHDIRIHIKQRYFSERNNSFIPIFNDVFD